MKNNIVILIPAYNPTEVLIQLVKDLKQHGYDTIIVVNDGSKNEDIFKKIKNDVTLLRHSENQGKGKALKTGFEYCLKNLKNILFIITVDADGQHLLQDIDNVYNKASQNSESIIIGCRDFNKNTPFRSLIGNKIISYIFKQKTKIEIKDTQTGLRAIPYIYLPELKNIKGERYEYETSMLIYAVNKKIRIIEQKIENVYINNNKESNFQIIKDSLKIIKLFYSKKQI